MADELTIFRNFARDAESLIKRSRDATMTATWQNGQLTIEIKDDDQSLACRSKERHLGLSLFSIFSLLVDRARNTRVKR